VDYFSRAAEVRGRIHRISLISALKVEGQSRADEEGQGADGPVCGPSARKIRDDERGKFSCCRASGWVPKPTTEARDISEAASAISTARPTA